MRALNTIRADLKEIRYYYSRKKLFDEACPCTGGNQILKKVDEYNALVQYAPPKFYDLYVSLYIKNHTQESLSDELGYTPEYIQMQHKQLLLYLQKEIGEKESK